MDRTYEILHFPFDMETHRWNFHNYLEVIILADGTVEYAVPSHVMTLESLVGDTDDAPMFGYLEWLCEKSGAIAVWNNFHIGEPNEKQQATLATLKREGLYKGKLVD